MTNKAIQIEARLYDAGLLANGVIVGEEEIQLCQFVPEQHELLQKIAALLGWQIGKSGGLNAARAPRKCCGCGGEIVPIDEDHVWHRCRNICTVRQWGKGMLLYEKFVNQYGWEAWRLKIQSEEVKQ